MGTFQSASCTSSAGVVTSAVTADSAASAADCASTKSAGSLPTPVTVRVWKRTESLRSSVHRTYERKVLMIECGPEVVDFIFWAMKQPLASVIDILRSTSIDDSRGSSTLRNVGSISQSLDNIRPYIRDEDFSFRTGSNMIARFPVQDSSDIGFYHITTTSEGEEEEEFPTHSHSPADSFVKEGARFAITKDLEILPLKGPELYLDEGIDLLERLGGVYGVQGSLQVFDQRTAWRLVDGILFHENPLNWAFL